MRFINLYITLHIQLTRQKPMLKLDRGSLQLSDHMTRKYWSGYWTMAKRCA